MRKFILLLMVSLLSGFAHGTEVDAQYFSFAGFDFYVEQGYEKIVVSPGLSKTVGFLYPNDAAGNGNRLFFTDLTFNNVFEGVDYGCETTEFYSSVFSLELKQQCDVEHVRALQEAFVKGRSVHRVSLPEAAVFYLDGTPVLRRLVAHAIIISNDGRVVMIESTAGLKALQRTLRLEEQ